MRIANKDSKHHCYIARTLDLRSIKWPNPEHLHAQTRYVGHQTPLNLKVHNHGLAEK